MKTYNVTYNTKGDSSILFSSNDSEKALAFAKEYVADEEKVSEDVDPFTDQASCFYVTVTAFDPETEEDPEDIYESDWYYER